MAGLYKSYENLQNVKIIENKNTESSRYKRDNLTGIGNTILTVNIFAKLIEIITKKKKNINVLYIIDDDFNIDMINIFKKCLYRDQVVIEKNYEFRIFLIYTQPDLALKNFINENYKKNKTIKYLEEKIDTKDKELKEIINVKDKELKEIIKAKDKEFKEMIVANNKKIEEEEKKFEYLFEEFQYELKFCEIDKEVIEFCKKIKNDKSLISIGILDIINEKHKYTFSSLNSINSLLKSNLKKIFI